jgi:hypothetical protein
MSQQISTDPPSHQNAPSKQQVKTPAALETLLQVVLQEAATAEEATIDTLISRFEDITSILKEAKRQRQVKRKYCENDGILDEHQPSSLDRDSKTLGNRARIPTEVLRQLTQSGFLSTADLAKTLLLTCKCYEIDLGREYVYEYLCRFRWRNIAKLPPSLIADRGYYWLFRNLSRPICTSSVEEPSMLPPPAFDYDEMLFSVSIRDGSGKEIISEVLCGDQLDTLKQDGTASVILEQPIITGTPGCARACDNWSVMVHLFRLDQNKCCCVHSSGSWDSQVPGLLTGMNITAEDVAGFVRFYVHQSDTALELDERGKLLERRIQELDKRGAQFLGIEFFVKLNCCVQERAPPYPDDLGEVHLVAHRVNPEWDDSDCFVEAQVQQHGVTLPHLLEHLKGWGDPDD